MRKAALYLCSALIFLGACEDPPKDSVATSPPEALCSRPVTKETVVLPAFKEKRESRGSEVLDFETASFALG